MKHRSLTHSLFALALILGVAATTALADTIRLKDGTIIRGEIVYFRDQKFTVLVGTGARTGRRSTMTLYMEDVESIEFDAAGAAGNAAGVETPDVETARPQPVRPAPVEPRPSSGTMSNSGSTAEN